MINRQLKRWLVGISLFIAIFALAGAAAGCGSSDSSSSPEELGLVTVEVEAPDFTLPTMAGPEITLSALQGKPVVLNCWALSCPPCRQELPYFDAAANQYAGKVTIVAVNLGDSVSKLEEFFGGNKVGFVVALDRDDQVASKYSTGYIPNTFFIDSQGIVRYLKPGAFINEEELNASIDKLLNY